jgi:Holliday junction resolvasome RuvABC endonuclease subunit
VITLGIDPSLTGFGWCIHRSDVVGRRRVWIKGVVKTEASALFVARYAFLKASLVRILTLYPEIEAVGVESPIFGAQFSSGAYALFVYVNEAIYLCRKDVVYFDPTTLKMLAKMDPKVRQGTMDKGDMIEAAKADTTIPKWDHNEADAFLIARSAARFWDLVTNRIRIDELTPSEERSFARVHTFTRGEHAGKTVKGGLLFREDDRFFKFSQIATIPDEEEQRQWLSQRGSPKILRLEAP